MDAPRDRAGSLFEKLDAHWCTACTDVMQKRVPEHKVTRCENYPAWLRTALYPGFACTCAS